MLLNWEEILIFSATLLIIRLCYTHKQWLYLEYSRAPSLLLSPSVLSSLPSLLTFKNMHVWFMDQLPTIGDVIGFPTLQQYIIILQSREALSEAFVKQSNSFSSRPALFFTKILNPGLHGFIDRPMTKCFKKYHQLTMSIFRTFGYGNMNMMEVRINREVEDLVTEIGQHQSTPINPKQLVNGSAFNVIASILFGHRFDRSDPMFNELILRNNEVVLGLLHGIPISMLPILRFLPHIKRHLNKIIFSHTLLLDILQKQIDETLSREAGSGEQSFIQSFIDAEGRDQFDRQELLYILRDMIIAGSETSTTTITWAIALLADNQDVQKKLHDEIDSVIDAPDSGSSTGKRLPSLADRAKLPYVEATILELMRFKTVMPLGMARETVNDTTLEGHKLPAGTTVLSNIYAIHMNPTVWKDPTKFRPERFLDESGNIINKEKVVTFSIDNRFCVGEQLSSQEIFLFITGLLRNFDILPPEGHDFLNCTEVVGVTVSPSPYKVRFMPRKKDL